MIAANRAPSAFRGIMFAIAIEAAGALIGVAIWYWRHKP
jgi:hypothetical protein